MREYKFRGRRIDNGEWIYGFFGRLTNGEAEKSYIMVSTLTFNPNTHVYFTDYEVDPETVGQYTGLKDKNGKEIYEGDVLATWHVNPETGWDKEDCGYTTVQWDDRYTCFEGSKWMWEMNPAESVYGIEYVEIIGNIHEGGTRE